MSIAPAQHLYDLQAVPGEQSFEPALPAQGLGMAGIAFLVLGDDVPDGMQFPMLAQEVVPAEQARMDVPDAHLSGYDIGFIKVFFKKKG